MDSSALIDDAYRRTTELLHQPTTFFSHPTTSLVGLRNVVDDPPLSVRRIVAESREENVDQRKPAPLDSSSASATGDAGGDGAMATAAVDSIRSSPAAVAAASPSVPSSPSVLSMPTSMSMSMSMSVSSPTGTSLPFTTLLTPGRGHHVVLRALEELAGYAKAEADLQQHHPLTPLLTSLATGQFYDSASEALAQLSELSRSIPRRVCQHPFKRNDIVWVCRTCQADETCVLCHSCFKQSNHEGHDVAFYHAQAGGCCDCGDVDAWDPSGFCPHHGPMSGGDLSMEGGSLGPDAIPRVRGVVPAAVDWMVKTVAEAAERAERRAQLGQDVSNETRIVNKSKASLPPASSPSSYLSSISRMGGNNSSQSSEESDGFDPNAAGRIKYHRSVDPDSTDLSLASKAGKAAVSRNLSPAQKLGIDGCKGKGLYLVLRSDDIHTTTQLADALRELFGTASLYTDSMLQKVIRELRQYGQLIVWGTMELMAEFTPAQIALWLDGDVLASGVIGNAMIRRASILVNNHGLSCSIVTRDELLLEQQAVAVLQWLMSVARSCDPLCQTVAESIGPDRHLVPLLKADFCLNTRITKYWHGLLLTLLAVPTFKSHLAAAYCDTYQHVTANYARGQGVLERSGYALSVQFLNRVTYVVDLVQSRDLLGKLGASLKETLEVAATASASSGRRREPKPDTMRRSINLDISLGEVLDLGDIGDITDDMESSTASRIAARKHRLINQEKDTHPSANRPRLNPNHFVLTHRRYSPCISDLKCVLNVKGMPRLFASTTESFLDDWISALSLGQHMDPQVWRNWTQGHVETETRGWVGAFNASISLGSLFERLLSWDDSDETSLTVSSPLTRNLLSCLSLTAHILAKGLGPWQKTERAEIYNEPTSSPLFASATSLVEPYQRCPASLPLSTIAVKNGTATAMDAYCIAQSTPFSFHLPLHRFVAACIREVCLRPDGIDDLFLRGDESVLASMLSAADRNELFIGLMEFPLLVMSRAAQIRAWLWRRNGPGLNDQVLNYAEPPFCRTMRDADLLLVQCAMLGRNMFQKKGGEPSGNDTGVSFLVHLLVHRLGIFDFCGLVKAPDSNVEQYQKEIKLGMFKSEIDVDDESNSKGGERGDGGENATMSGTVFPWTYTPCRDAVPSLLLLEEFIYMMIMLVSELPSVPPQDKNEHTMQAKSRLQREVVHRLASGPKTHSELSEVHHVLSHCDNVVLSDEGKLVNPDDATGAALASVLADVAERKASRGKMEPDKWHLLRHAWDQYDPSFFHISLRSHQTAAESRPALSSSSDKAEPLFGVPERAFAPPLIPAHPSFSRIRRDITSDATVIAIVYRTIHMHCRDASVTKDMSLAPGASAYESNERSETALTRAVHLLTLGAYAWADQEKSSLQQAGGTSVGSIFYRKCHEDDTFTPGVKDWISAALLASPEDMLASQWYEGEETMLQLLRRLASDGGSLGGFVAQDRAVRAGAAWLCRFAVKHSPRARSLLGTGAGASSPSQKKSKKSSIEKRKRLAKQKAMDRMKAQAAQFASTMANDLAEDGDNVDNNTSDTYEIDDMPNSDVSTITTQSPRQASRLNSFGSTRSSLSSSSEIDQPSTPLRSDAGGPAIPPRLRVNRPQCIICNDAENAEMRNSEQPEGSHRKSRRRKHDGGNALAFVGYIQASTVLKGGGGPPGTGDYTETTPLRRFVGTHVALCGHAVHSECWESYLSTLSQREERIIGKRDEFRCPLCQRLSNCLVPFIDVGADWIAPAICHPASRLQTTPSKTDDDGAASMSCDDETTAAAAIATSPSDISSFHDFLSTTPWWVSRHNDDVAWDGQCAFVANSAASPMDVDSDNEGESESKSGEEEEDPKSPSRRKAVRLLRKKDLYAAWNAMMRTPRSVRRRLRSRGSTSEPSLSSSNGGEGGQSDAAVSPFLARPSTESSGETVVWRRFMDQVSDISYRADSKRLGDTSLHLDFGEFRHYVIEKYSYNMVNRQIGKESTDWPSCVFPSALSETQRQELSREKLLSKLMMSMQALTYSCSSEANEASRLLRGEAAEMSNDASGPGADSGIAAISSKFGITGLVCNGQILLMPQPVAHEENGEQPFHGRLGRLRYFGLAVMAAAGAVAADLVQLVLQFPTNRLEGSLAEETPLRAPIVYPILLGHVLTHVVAAMSATCGRDRARSDSLELAWPIPFSSGGSFIASNSNARESQLDSVARDCEGFVKLGLLARVAQVLLGKIDIIALKREFHGTATAEDIVLYTLNKFRQSTDSAQPSREDGWMRTCMSILESAMSNNSSQSSSLDVPSGASEQIEKNITDRFREGCKMSLFAARAFLADAGNMLQILLPGVILRYTDRISEQVPTAAESIEMATILAFDKLMEFYRFEPIADMLKSSIVRDVLANWYAGAMEHARNTALPEEPSLGSGLSVNSRLFQTQGFHVVDWPQESCRSINNLPQMNSGKSKKQDSASQVVPMEIEPIQSISTPPPQNLIQRSSSTPLVTFSSKKTVDLIGGYIPDSPDRPNAGSSSPRISSIPTSYTDLYAELGLLLPESEQTAVCLVCGAVLNAGGKGECTRHSYTCGAGQGMFFLLQECTGLIMHNSKAAYIHSPYVDSHGETPQYRGRPLNLDLDRYEHLREIWSGHSIRQQVIAERLSSRQIIVLDFY